MSAGPIRRRFGGDYRPAGKEGVSLRILSMGIDTATPEASVMPMMDRFDPRQLAEHGRQVIGNNLFRPSD